MYAQAVAQKCILVTFLKFTTPVTSTICSSRTNSEDLGMDHRWIHSFSPNMFNFEFINVKTRNFEFHIELLPCVLVGPGRDGFGSFILGLSW